MSSYRHRPKTMLDDARLLGQYLGAYRICVDEDGHTLYVSDAYSDDEQDVSSLVCKVIAIMLRFFRHLVRRSCFLTPRFCFIPDFFRNNWLLFFLCYYRCYLQYTSAWSLHDIFRGVVHCTSYGPAFVWSGALRVQADLRYDVICTTQLRVAVLSR